MVEPLNPQHLDPADPHYVHSTDEPVLERIAIATEGEDCDECVRKLREPLMRIPGVCDVRVNTKRERVIVTFDARKTHPPDLHDAILSSGYKPAPVADTLSPLVPRLGADPVLLTQRSKIERLHRSHCKLHS